MHTSPPLSPSVGTDSKAHTSSPLSETRKKLEKSLKPHAIIDPPSPTKDTSDLTSEVIAEGKVMVNSSGDSSPSLSPPVSPRETTKFQRDFKAVSAKLKNPVQIVTWKDKSVSFDFSLCIMLLIF